MRHEYNQVSGADKTTLLNHILQKTRGTNFLAMIENEFGEINFDQESW